MTLGAGLVRDKDGLLYWTGGRFYRDPGEAVKTWWAGELRISCAAPVYGDWSYKPCGKIAKHDPDANGNPTRCGTHCASAVAKREAASQAREAARQAKWGADKRLGKARADLEQALRLIALGHNDPRTLAQEALAELEAAREAAK